MCTGHFFGFGSRIFYLAVVVEQKRLLLLKKLINFLHRKHTHSQKSKEEVLRTLSEMTSCKKIIQQPHLYSSENDLVRCLHHVLEEPTKHFFSILSSHAELKWKNNKRNNVSRM